MSQVGRVGGLIRSIGSTFNQKKRIQPNLDQFISLVGKVSLIRALFGCMGGSGQEMRPGWVILPNIIMFIMVLKQTNLRFHFLLKLVEQYVRSDL